jgi:hypothetical protein
VYSLGRCAWPTSEESGSPEYGVNFSCKQAEHLGLACETLFRQTLTELRVRSVRLSAYWSDVERVPGVYDFSQIDRLLAIAHEHGARVTVSVGMKAQRYPEFWFPTWLRLAADLAPDGYPEDNPLVEQALVPYLAAAARHIGAHPAVEAIQVENEPFVHFQGHANGWRIRRSFLAREIETVRANDPGGHPIVVSHASWLRKDETWRWIIDHADVLAQSVYAKRQRGPWPWLYIFPYRIGPWTPDLPGQVREAKRSGRALWIGELQAEPYEHPRVDVRTIPTAEARSFSQRRFRDNMRLAERSGATRVYLWGVEWWAYLRLVRGEPGLWELARETLGNSQPATGNRQQ